MNTKHQKSWELPLGQSLSVVGIQGRDSREYHVCKHVLDRRQRWWEVAQCTRELIKDCYDFLDEHQYPLGETLHGIDLSNNYKGIFPRTPVTGYVTSRLYQRCYEPELYRVLSDLSHELDGGQDRLYLSTSRRPGEEVSAIVMDPDTRLCVIIRADSKAPRRLITRTCYRISKRSVRIDELVSSLSQD